MIVFKNWFAKSVYTPLRRRGPVPVHRGVWELGAGEAARFLGSGWAVQGDVRLWEQVVGKILSSLPPFPL